MEVGTYHRLLRSALMVFAFLLVFSSGILFPVTKQLSDNAVFYLASLGSSISVSVPPNEINTLSAQIAQKQKELDAREASLHEREIQARSFGSQAPEYAIYIISIILFIIIVLLMLNYAMDIARVRKYAREKQTI